MCFNCDRTDELYREHATEFRCGLCNMAERDYIFPYFYKPHTYTMYGSSPLLGVELEVECTGERFTYNDPRTVVEMGNGRLYIKADGSLNYGYEIVSMPMDLKNHLSFNWQEILTRQIDSGFRSHDTETCGMHVHVDREAFGYNEEEREERINRLLYIFHKWWEPLVKVSRRDGDRWKQYSHYHINPDYHKDPKETLETLKRIPKHKYQCINTTGANTIEFRLWKGTLNYNTFITTLTLTSSMVDATMLDIEEIAGMSWWEFVDEMNLPPTVIDYIKKKTL